MTIGHCKAQSDGCDRRADAGRVGARLKRPARPANTARWRRPTSARRAGSAAAGRPTPGARSRGRRTSGESDEQGSAVCNEHALNSRAASSAAHGADVGCATAVLGETRDELAAPCWLHPGATRAAHSCNRAPYTASPMTRELFDSFWRAAAYCLHPKVIALSLAAAGDRRRRALRRSATSTGSRRSPACAPRSTSRPCSSRCSTGCARSAPATEPACSRR